MTITPSIEAIADALLQTVRHLAAGELRAAANEYECDGAIVDALASQARSRGDLAGEAAYAITASDFQHIVGRLRARAAALDMTRPAHRTNPVEESA